MRTILNKHWEAMGGMSNWSKVESIRLNGTIERDGQIADIVIVKKSPNKVRSTITLPLSGSPDDKLQLIRAHDGKNSWRAARLAGYSDIIKEELPPELAGDLLADAGVLPVLIKVSQEGAKLELLEPSTIGGKDVIVIRSSQKDQDNQDIFFLSTKSFLLLVHESQSPANGITRTTYTGYNTHSGIQLPTRSIIESSQTGRAVITTEPVEVGVGIYQEYFAVDKTSQDIPSL